MSLDLRDNDDRTYLMYALLGNCSVSVVKRLIRTSSDVNTRDNDWTSVLMYALDHASEDTLPVILSHISAVSTTDIYAERILTSGQIEAGEIIIKLLKLIKKQSN